MAAKSANREMVEIDEVDYELNREINKNSIELLGLGFFDNFSGKLILNWLIWNLRFCIIIYIYMCVCEVGDNGQ